MENLKEPCRGRNVQEVYITAPVLLITLGIIGAVARECLSLGLREECTLRILGPLKFWRIRLSVATVDLEYVSKGGKVTDQIFER